MTLKLEKFTANVSRFCQWAESGTHDIETARQLLLALMQDVPDSVVADDAGEDEPEYPRREFEGWQVDHKRFSDFPFQYYRMVFSPCQLDEEESVVGDVHDDLADIYGDLWHGAQALSQGQSGYALNYWRESYFQHWGHHAASALYAIDEYYRNSPPPDNAIH